MLFTVAVHVSTEGIVHVVNLQREPTTKPSGSGGAIRDINRQRRSIPDLGSDLSLAALRLGNERERQQKHRNPGEARVIKHGMLTSGQL